MTKTNYDEKKKKTSGLLTRRIYTTLLEIKTVTKENKAPGRQKYCDIIGLSDVLW